MEEIKNTIRQWGNWWFHQPTLTAIIVSAVTSITVSIALSILLVRVLQ